jgi:deazaflavin-dependent oxidoreductase (nitroreductase family)
MVPAALHGAPGAVPGAEAVNAPTRGFAPTSTAQRASRPLLGLRRTPGRLTLAVFRLPLHLYRHGWGWLLGHTFLFLVHLGRTTGQPHETVAMVLGDDVVTGELVICSAWGPDTDWIRNLRSAPAKEVRIGRECFAPQHRFLTDDEAVTVGIAFRQHHPHRLRLISALLGWGDLRQDDAMRDFVRGHPFVALRPTTNAQ